MLSVLSREMSAPITGATDMMQGWFDDQRFRVGAFILSAVFLLVVFVWSAFSADPSTSEGRGNESPAASASGPAVEGFSQPSRKPSATASSPPKEDLPPPDPLPLPNQQVTIPRVSPNDVVVFLKVANTFSWRLSMEDYEKWAQKAGAVKGSPAVTSPLSEYEWAECISNECSREFIEASSITINEGESASALVRVRTTSQGLTYEETLECAISLANGTEPNPGKFTVIDCYRGA